MAEQLSKLRPDRDLQCYFQEPSAVAALSGASANGFTVSGCWRQQFDWAVVEWNRDNVFEHPALRNLPDGNLSGLRLSYEEVRTNCIGFDSTAYDPIGWSFLRIWEEHAGNNGDPEETIHWIPLNNYCTPVDGEYVASTATLVLQGSPSVGDLIELAWLHDHCNYMMAPGDTLESAVSGLAANINHKREDGCAITASAEGAAITLTYLGAPGFNGNRIGIYGGVTESKTESWSPSWATFGGGISPSRWRVNLDFSHLVDSTGATVDTRNVRRMRWTWAADLQDSNFQRSEFSVVVGNWQASGTGLGYLVAGPGSRRISLKTPGVQHTGVWAESKPGNYWNGLIWVANTKGAHVSWTYSAPSDHSLYLGTRYVGNGATVSVQIDSSAPKKLNLSRPGEDILIRHLLGSFSANTPHTVSITHDSSNGDELHFNFFEIAVPTTNLPDFSLCPTTTLATDWDTEHSLAIAPERTAWLISKLGFRGRANHYTGAMWFYELACPGNRFASATVEFAGTPHFMDVTKILLAGTEIQHISLTSDTAASIAKCFELLIAAGTSAVWAKAEGSTLTITSRTMGIAGNGLPISASHNGTGFSATASVPSLGGGTGDPASLDSAWRTDLTSLPRLNRACRDWNRSYFVALKAAGIEATAAFSMELRHGDDQLSTGIAQRYPAGPVWVNTPAIQTNFSPASLAFWTQIYLDTADVMADAGMTPYLQFGEVQWWYKADDGSGMPYYDEYAKSLFESTYGQAMRIVPNENADPVLFLKEAAFLPSLIGQFTQRIVDAVSQVHSDARFEVLYPSDVNESPWNRLVNFPSTEWNQGKLTCLKTENFIYTGDRNLNKARQSINLPLGIGFSPSKNSHLIGISDGTTPWQRERRLAIATGVESVVLWALDQFCLIGYDLPLDSSSGRAGFMGK